MSFPSGFPVAESENLRDAVEDLARRLSDIEAVLPRKRGALPDRAISDLHLADVAERIYRARRRRERYFPGALFAEPAWDILLDLFISKARGQRVSTSGVTIAAGIPMATGLRRLSMLEKHGLLRRYTAPDDARLTLLELTPQGYRMMQAWVSEWLTSDDMPAAG